MARSSYIYVVTGVLDYEPVAGFTVKHELVSWLKDHPDDHFVWRIPDGRYSKRKPVDITEEMLRAIT